MKILIAYDGSESADVAVNDLPRAGLPAQAEAVVVSVADVWPHLPPESYQAIQPGDLEKLPLLTRRAHVLASHAMAEAKEISQRGAQRLTALFPAWKVTAETHAGSPPEAILRRAEEWKSDLTVVGSHGRGALARLALGSVAQKIVSYSHCSVRVARRRQEPAGATIKILLGVDGSEGAATAISAVATRTWPANTEVQIVSALDLRVSTVLPSIEMPMGQWVSVGDKDEREWVQRAVEATVHELTAAGLAATPVVREGDPKQVLLNEAKLCGADCIFVGAKGMSRIERFLLGSVSASIAARATCSVEVVRFG